MVIKLNIIEGMKDWYCNCGMAHDIMYKTDDKCYCEKCVPIEVKAKVI